MWSPDGKQILYIGAKENAALFDANELYIVPRRGARPALTDNLDGDVTPSWSPDGTWIVFSSDRKEANGTYTSCRSRAGRLRG